MKLTALLLITCFSTVALAGAPQDPPPPPNAQQIDKDLTVDPPVENDTLKAAIQAKIDQLSQTGLQDATPSSISIPDYKPAYDNLQKSIAGSIQNYLATLTKIFGELQEPLSNLKAILDERNSIEKRKYSTAEEKTRQVTEVKVFTDLLESEAQRIIPVLNAHINDEYHEAIKDLYRLGDLGNGYHVPYDEESNERGYYSCSDIHTYDQDRLYLSSNNQNATYSNVKSEGSGCFKGEHHSFSGWDADALNALVSFAQGHLFFDCETAGCVDLLAMNISTALRFAASLNQEIFFKKTSINTGPRKGGIDTQPEFALAILSSAQKLLDGPDVNGRSLVASALANQGFEKSAGVALSLAGVTAAILEKPIRVAAAILTATSGKYELKLKPADVVGIDDVENQLNNIVKLTMPKMVGVQYGSAATDNK